MRLLLLVTAAFVLGIFTSDFFRSNYRMLFGGVQNINCLPDGGPCVGDKLSEVRIGGIYLFDKIGGLTLVICEDINPNVTNEERLFVDDILKGRRCEGEVQGFAFRNSTTRTVVIVKNDEITEIRLGPLHVIDL